MASRFAPRHQAVSMVTADIPPHAPPAAWGGVRRRCEGRAGRGAFAPPGRSGDSSRKGLLCAWSGGTTRGTALAVPSRHREMPFLDRRLRVLARRCQHRKKRVMSKPGAVLLISLLGVVSFSWGCSSHALVRMPARLTAVPGTRVVDRNVDAARQMMQRGDYAEALAAIEQVLSLHPRHVDAHRVRQQLLQSRGRSGLRSSETAAACVGPSGAAFTPCVLRFPPSASGSLTASQIRSR